MNPVIRLLWNFCGESYKISPYPRKIKYPQNIRKKDKFFYNRKKNLCGTLSQNM